MTEATKRRLNIAQLQAKWGNRSRSSIYRDVEAGRLPPPTHIGSRPYWDEAEVDAAWDRLKEREAA